MVKALLEMSARITTLEQQVLALTKQIAFLSTNSTNSSKPPSSDGPGVLRPKKEKMPRPQGAQKGHKRHKTELRTVSKMDHVHNHSPAVCEKCAAPLDPQSCEEICSPLRHQTFELQEIKPIMTEHRCHELNMRVGTRPAPNFLPRWRKVSLVPEFMEPRDISAQYIGLAEGGSWRS